MRLAYVVRPLQEATRLDRKQFAILLGLRAAASTFVPLLVGVALAHPSYRWAGIAGFCATTTDKGGAYATRARTFAALMVASCVTVFVGSLAGESLPWSVALGFIVVTTGALARVFGTEAISVGTISSLMFLLSVAQPEPTASLAIERAAVVALGIGWAALLGLVVWPVRVFAPARRAVASVFQALGLHAENLGDQVADAGTRDWHEQLRRDHTGVRLAVEAARSHLASIRGNSRGTSGKGAWLLGLLQTADQAFARVISVSEGLETARASNSLTAIEPPLRQVLREIATACHALAEFAVDENEDAAVPRPTLSTNALIGALETAQPPLAPLPRAQVLHMAELLTAIEQTLATVTPVSNAVQEPTTPWFIALRAAISVDSVEARHAVRVGLLVAASVGVTTAFEIDHGYWATITMLVVLQPHAPATLLRSVQRIGGTVIGALLAVAIASLLPDPKYLIFVCMVMSAVSVSVIQVNYALYSTLLTPTFVLLAQVNGLDWRLAGLRAATTTVAGVVALIASRVFWPSSERSRIADELARALSALRRLLEVIAAKPRATADTLAVARRAFGVSVNNADVSLQRFVAERAVAEHELEPVITMLLYMRRFCWSALAVTTLPGRPELPAELAQACEGVLLELAQACTDRRPPEPLTTMGIASADAEPLLRGQLDRLVQHLQVLHDATTRLAKGAVIRTDAVDASVQAPQPAKQPR